MTNEVAVVVFMKNEVLGLAKTRIAAEAGQHRALDIYQRLVRRTADTLRASQLPCHVYYSHFIATYDRWIWAQGRHLQRSSDDLGQRMAHAIQATRQRYRSVIIIGTDCPGLTAAHLQQAATALHTHDVCIGPATDGGFYLLGLRQWSDALFDGVSWSTDGVAASVMRQASMLGWSMDELPVLSDVDYLADWEAFLSRGHIS